MTDQCLADLRTLSGISAVLEDGDNALHLVCDAATGDEAASPPEMRARAVILQHLGDSNADAVRLHVSYLNEPQPRRRVRFQDARLEPRGVRAVEAIAEVEWNDRTIQGTAPGPPTEAAAVRLCAEATLRALEAMLEGRLRFRLRGAKTVQAFDHNLAVALVEPEYSGAGRLVGVAISTDSVPHAASRAVLNATNRVLGNYLDVG